jgi:hypothetical protein
MITKRHEADAKGAVEDEIEQIDVVDASEVLGYYGRGREEHSGENSPQAIDQIEIDLLEELMGDRKK